MNYSAAEFVPAMKALSDETRLKIIDMLSCGPLCACDILEEFSISQPTLSYHMKILTESGLVKGARDGAWMRYSLNQGKADQTIAFLSHISHDKDDCICKTSKNKNMQEICC